MNTKFEEVYDIFFRKIIESEDFFMYTNISELETEEIIKKKAFGYMEESISTILEYATPEVDFNDYDILTEEFGFEMTKTELQLITDLMVEKHIEKDLLKLKIMTKFFSTNEVSLFSPANDRKTFVDMHEMIKKKNIRFIRSYNSRDRTTNALKSYGGVSY